MYIDADSPEEAHRRIRQAREQSPIAMGLHGPEILSYELVRSVLFDSRFGVAKGVFLESQGVTSGRLWDRFRDSMMSLDGREHNRIRRLASPAFAPRAIRRMQQTIADVITMLLDPVIPMGRCDVVEDISKSFPSPILCAFVGAPVEDWPLFLGWADDICSMFSLEAAAKQDTIMKAYDELDGYLADLVAQRRDNLADDLVSELVRTDRGGEVLTQRELCRLVSALLITGTDTSRNQLAAAVGALCDHPEQWALLAEEPELAPQAVAELMRHTPAVMYTLKQALEDVELAGVVIPAGTQVAVNIAAANRDPDVHDDPERLDITRQDPPPTLVFGAGPHFCLGLHLAKMELAQALIAITGRMRNPRRVGPAPWKPFAPVTGPLTLPIEFDVEVA
ncbi:cytochrome P450 [Mycobacterium angelicum]|nr:cytochrome P450 [Mycobacterium angelicum]MCV7200373.1 cytochrome P450 [Mycobacterium angelicum]